MFITERSIITDVIPLLVLLLVNLRKVTVLLLFLGLSRLGQDRQDDGGESGQDKQKVMLL